MKKEMQKQTAQAYKTSSSLNQIGEQASKQLEEVLQRD